MSYMLERPVVGGVYRLLEQETVEHYLVLDVDEYKDFATARAIIHILEKNETLDVHARTMMRFSERIA